MANNCNNEPCSIRKQERRLELAIGAINNYLDNNSLRDYEFQDVVSKALNDYMDPDEISIEEDKPGNHGRNVALERARDILEVIPFDDLIETGIMQLCSSGLGKNVQTTLAQYKRRNMADGADPTKTAPYIMEQYLRGLITLDRQGIKSFKDAWLNNIRNPHSDIACDKVIPSYYQCFASPAIIGKYFSGRDGKDCLCPDNYQNPRINWHKQNAPRPCEIEIGISITFFPSESETIIVEKKIYKRSEFFTEENITGIIDKIISALIEEPKKFIECLNEALSDIETNLRTLSSRLQGVMRFDDSNNNNQANWLLTRTAARMYLKYMQAKDGGTPRAQQYRNPTLPAKDGQDKLSKNHIFECLKTAIAKDRQALENCIQFLTSHVSDEPVKNWPESRALVHIVQPSDDFGGDIPTVTGWQLFESMISNHLPPDLQEQYNEVVVASKNKNPNFEEMYRDFIDNLDKWVDSTDPDEGVANRNKWNDFLLEGVRTQFPTTPCPDGEPRTKPIHGIDDVDERAEIIRNNDTELVQCCYVEDLRAELENGNIVITYKFPPARIWDGQQTLDPDSKCARQSIKKYMDDLGRILKNLDINLVCGSLAKKFFESQLPDSETDIRSVFNADYTWPKKDTPKSCIEYPTVLGMDLALDFALNVSIFAGALSASTRGSDFLGSRNSIINKLTRIFNELKTEVDNEADTFECDE